MWRGMPDSGAFLAVFIEKVSVKPLQFFCGVLPVSFCPPAQAFILEIYVLV